MSNAKKLAAFCTASFVLEQNLVNARRAGNLEEAAGWKDALVRTHRDIETLATRIGR